MKPGSRGARDGGRAECGMHGPACAGNHRAIEAVSDENVFMITTDRFRGGVCLDEIMRGKLRITFRFALAGFHIFED